MKNKMKKILVFMGVVCFGSSQKFFLDPNIVSKKFNDGVVT